MAVKGNYRIRKNMNKRLAEKTARASRFPVETHEPELEKQSYEEQTNGNEIEIWHWSHTSFSKRGTVFNSNQSNLL